MPKQARTIANYYIKVKAIERKMEKLRKQKLKLSEKFLEDNEDWKVDVLFRSLHTIFGSAIAVYWYNRVFYDGEDTVTARSEILAYVNKE